MGGHIDLIHSRSGTIKGGQEVGSQTVNMLLPGTHAYVGGGPCRLGLGWGWTSGKGTRETVSSCLDGFSVLLGWDCLETQRSDCSCDGETKLPAP